MNPSSDVSILLLSGTDCLNDKVTHRASRLFKQPSAITICCGCSKRTEIQRQCGIQEETEHVYSNDANTNSRSSVLRQLKVTLSASLALHHW